MISATFSKPALQLPFSSCSWSQSNLQFSVRGVIVSTSPLRFFSNLIIISPACFPRKMSYDWKGSFTFKSHWDEKYSVCLNHDSHFIDGETRSAGMWKDLPPAVITAWSVYSVSSTSSTASQIPPKTESIEISMSLDSLKVEEETTTVILCFPPGYSAALLGAI